jgi:hypothetical protein
MKDKRCPKCGSVMVAGFVCDSTVSLWSEAKQPGLGFPQPAIPKNQQHKGSPMYPISTCRCSGCGYIEWYAMPLGKS